MTCYLSHCLSCEQIVTKIMEKEEEVMVSVLLALIRSHVEPEIRGLNLDSKLTTYKWFGVELLVVLHFVRRASA